MGNSLVTAAIVNINTLFNPLFTEKRAKVKAGVAIYSKAKGTSPSV